MKFVKPNQLDTKAPGTWPIYYQIVVWAFIVVLMIFLYNQFFREDLLNQQDSNQSEISQLEQKYRQLYQYSRDLPLYEKRKEELVQKLKSFLKYLPAETEMPSLIDDIYKAGYKSNINFKELTPQDSAVNKYYNTEPISLKTSTGFSNFENFVQYIGELSRILNIRSFELEIDQSTPDTMNISSSLETYIYNQDIDKFINSGKKVAK